MIVVQCATGVMTVSPVLSGLKLPLDINRESLPVARIVQSNWGIVVPKDSPLFLAASTVAIDWWQREGAGMRNGRLDIRPVSGGRRRRDSRYRRLPRPG